MTFSWVGSRELAFSKTPENLIRLAHQVFSPMAFLGVGSHVLAPGSSVIFDIAHENCILDSSVDYEGYFISSKGFLLMVVDIIVI